MSVPSDKRRTRPFLMEFVLALALLAAALHWARGGFEDGARHAGRNLPAEPATTGSLRSPPPRPAETGAAPDAGAPAGALRGVLDAFAVLGRR